MTAAIADRPEEDFPDPPDELLEGEPEPTIALDPPNLLPGGSTTVNGEGFDECIESWSVAVDGTPWATPPDTGSDTSERRAVLTIGGSAVPGQYRVVALCDGGAGPEVIAEAVLVVDGPTTSTAAPTSTPSSTTDTTVLPTTSVTTGRPTTTVTTPPSSTTTTTSGGGGGGP
jgi:hypothetical protein